MKLKFIALVALFLLCAGFALSQQPPAAPLPPEPGQAAPRGQAPNPRHPQMPQPPGQPAQAIPPHPPGDPLAGNLFPPELVMQHKQAIGLTEQQKTAIREELIKASTHFNELQFQMQDEMETLAGLTKGTTIDEQRVLAQLDKVLAVEREVKRAQLAVAIRIKNKLTAEQQTQLQEIQRHMHQPPPPQ